MRVLYLEGDVCSPKYVRGTMAKAGLDVHVVLDEPCPDPLPDFDVAVLSDYPARQLTVGCARALVGEVEAGAGLLMVGGWKSFGVGGWARSPVAAALPVRIRDGDDRVNLASGAFLRPRGAHPALDGLDFAHPPVLGGYNDVETAPGAEVVLEAARVARVEGRTAVLSDAADPVIVLGAHGRGRVAALATDLAPHWSGGWTDWGEPRVDVGEGEEVGGDYLAFVRQLVGWLGRAEERDGRAGARAPASRPGGRPP